MSKIGYIACTGVGYMVVDSYEHPIACKVPKTMDEAIAYCAKNGIVVRN